MKGLSLQWRITIMTALLTCAACVLTNCLVGYTGMRYMDAIGSDISALSAAGVDAPQAFDPTKGSLDDEVTIVVNDAQESFGTTAWRITAGVTLLGGVLAYFVSGRALKPLRAFADQVERVQPDNLSEIRLSEDVPTELLRCSASFNDMIARPGEGFSAQRQFTGNAAHELRTPLALMQTQLDTYAEVDSSVSAEEAIAVLRDQTERLSKVVRTLLDMSELQSVPRTDRIDIGPMVEEVLTDLLPLAEKKKITLAQEGGNVRMTGSDILIYRVLYNLVENGIKYNKQGGNVTVSYRQEENMAVIHVTDTGQGIPEKCQSNIFQPFYRIDKSRSREYGGVGLGLAFAWESVRLHGGSISVLQSTPEGSTIEVELPV